MVCACEDSVTGKKVAVKKVGGLTKMSRTELVQTLREVRILKHLSQYQHPHLMQLEACLGVPCKTDNNIEDLYLVCGHMPFNLQQVLPSLRSEHITRVMKGLLEGIAFLHDAGILHRDLKPANILVDEQGHVRVADFGHALAHGEKREQMYTYVVTRWYRAPELLLDCRRYGEAVDMWAIGCIFAEMMTSKALFRGDDSKTQLKLILECLGKPAFEDTKFIDNDKLRTYFQFTMPNRDQKDWTDVCAGALNKVGPRRCSVAFHLLDNLLKFSPDKRLTAQQAREHMFFDELEYQALPVDQAPYTGDQYAKDELLRLNFLETFWYADEANGVSR